MFLNFKKITTATETKRSDILVNSHAIMLLDPDIYNGEECTRVEIFGTKFFTPSLLDDIGSVLPIVDIRGGMYSLDPVDTLYPETTPPFLRCNLITNDVGTNASDYAVNPSYILFAEVVTYWDKGTNSNANGLMVVLKDVQQPRRLLTNMDYNELLAILSVHQVPVP